MPLYINNLDKYRDYIVVVHCGNSDSTISDIQGLISGSTNVKIDTRAELMSSAASSLVEFGKNMVEGALSKASSALGSAFGENFQMIGQSAKDWQSGSKFAFDIGFNVFKSGLDGVGTTSSFKELNLNLAKMTQSKPVDNIITDKQQSYYDYLDTSNSEELQDRLMGEKEANLFTVSIGNWFVCPGLIPISTSISYSPYVDLSGSPIYATVNISFETFRILTAEEWGNIIRV